MTNSPSNDPQESRSAALARIEAVERSLEQLVASVRSSAAELQEELSQVRLSVLELHSHAVSRPTPLPTGMTGWLRTFRVSQFEGVPAGLAAAVEQEIVQLLKPSLCDQAGQWTADYVRLQFVAERT